MTGALFSAGTRETAVSRHMQLLEEGLVHVDYGDEDHVFLVRVDEVPRVRLPVPSPRRLAEVLPGLWAELVEVSVANHVRVRLAAEDGPVKQAMEVRYAEDFKTWAGATGGEPPVQSPSWPAEAIMRLEVGLADDLGTSYQWSSGQAGGERDVWLAERLFRPLPPAAARRLILTYTLDGQPAGRTDVPLVQPS